MRGCSIVGLGLVAFTTLAAYGCGSSDPPAGLGATDGGTNTNPDGVPYPSPSGGYGRNARSGSTPGSVMANFKFQGYLSGDPSKGLTTLSLADYYDPCNRRYAMIHLTAAGVWCQPCSQETDEIVAAKASLVGQRIVVLQALGDGPVFGTPATKSDLDFWVKQHASNFTEMLDPGYANFAGFFNPHSVPWNVDLDPRTMEILDEGSGWPGNVAKEITTSVLPSAPSYSLPVTCK